MISFNVSLIHRRKNGNEYFIFMSSTQNQSEFDGNDDNLIEIRHLKSDRKRNR